MHFDSFETKHISVQVFDEKKVVCSLSFQSSQTIEFFLNVFAEFAEFSDQKYYKKIIQTVHLLCKIQRCYQSASKTEVAERISKLSPIHASVIYQIPEFS